jgi:2-dehydropantoate 2-reductase
MEPGVVVTQSATLAGLLDIGRDPAASDERVRTIAAAFESAGYQSVVRSDVMRWKYATLLLNLGNVV